MADKETKKPRKVLISFIGTGSLEGKGVYRTAKYRFSENEVYETSFIADALRRKYSLDTIILVGTVKSMWDNVYDRFCPEGVKDESIMMDLAEFREKASHDLELEIPHKDALDSILGDGGQAVLVKYGLDKEEQQLNSEIILGLEQYLRNGDLLYIDITHAFRSLPMMLMNTILYLKEVSQKKITIESISYGMLDVSRELGYTPVVELNSILEINEWIRGAYVLKEFGDGSIVADKLENEEAKTNLKLFTDVMHLGIPGSIRSSVSKLSHMKTGGFFNEENAFARLVLNPVVGNLLGKFEGKNLYEVQFKAAKWHYEHKNYGASFLILQEAILSCAVLRNSLQPGRKEDREKVSTVMKGMAKSDNIVLNEDLTTLYNKVRKTRNKIAHSISGNTDVEKTIDDLRTYLKDFSQLSSKSVIDRKQDRPV